MTNWYLVDSDCCQYMRNDNGTKYELVQCVWLDTTSQDKANGLHEYCIVHVGVDMDDMYAEEIECYLASYGYTMESLEKEYGVQGARDMYAECILETDALSDNFVIGEADTFEEAEAFIKEFINRKEVKT